MRLNPVDHVDDTRFKLLRLYARTCTINARTCSSV